MTFEEAVIRLAQEDGVGMLLQIPGVWEHVSESYNNDAIDLMRRENTKLRCPWCGKEAQGNCGNCGVTVCGDCHHENRCCDGPVTGLGRKES